MKTRREQNPRLGSLPAQGCLEEATESGIPGICCLVPEPPFLGKHGSNSSTNRAAPEVWAERYRRRKFPNCDEEIPPLKIRGARS
jgi:hypothetical protein